jgi:HEAT repeat protein
MTLDFVNSRLHLTLRMLRVGSPMILGLVLFTGCLPKPIVHKKVNRKPADKAAAPTRIGFAATSAPNLLRDDQVMPATLLVPTFEERSEQEVAAEALSLIGPPAVDELRAALQNRDPRVRREAAGVLARMGPEAKESVPDLTRLLDDEDEATRKMAARALGRIGPDAASAVPALMRTMLEIPDAAPK